MKYSLPVIFGVLTPNNIEQARDRAGGKHGNKGEDAAIAAIKMTHIKRTLNI
jgi:6,7-dimethyl-8-ribityllumazine synthase